jgi:xanthine phosphoribosyltransferase
VKKIYYPYSEFIDDLKELISKIDVEFDTIVGVARGGLTISHLLGEYYNIRDVFSINSIGYIDDIKLDSVKIFNFPDLNRSRVILVVDDIVDSGDTLIQILEKLKGRYQNLDIYTASIFYKESAKIKPDFFVKEAREWIDFFWSVDLKL